MKIRLLAFSSFLRVRFFRHLHYFSVKIGPSLKSVFIDDGRIILLWILPVPSPVRSLRFYTQFHAAEFVSVSRLVYTWSGKVISSDVWEALNMDMARND